MIGSPRETHLSASVARLTFQSSEAESVGVGTFTSVVEPPLLKPLHSAASPERSAFGL